MNFTNPLLHWIFGNHLAGLLPNIIFPEIPSQKKAYGLPVNPWLNDYRRMRVAGSSADSLKFNVPTLRNIVQTFPYMHDGRFSDLSNVYEHYNSGVVDGPTTDPLLKNKIPLSSIERSFLTEFLKTLTDSAFVGPATHMHH